MYHLSNEEICLACDAAEQFWISGKTEHMEMIRLKLSLEEMLLNYQAHLGRNVEFTVKFKKMLGHRQVLVFLPGSSYDPFSCNEDEDQALLRRLTYNSSGTYKWSYKDGVNIICFEPPRKRLLSSSLGIFIAIISAVLVALVCTRLPDHIRGPLLDGYISPIQNTLMGIIFAVSGPMIFFSLVWGIKAIGDVNTLSKIGKNMLASFMLELFLLTFLAAMVCFPFFSIASSGALSFDMSEILALLLGIVPNNMLAPFVEGNVQQIIFLAFVLGIVLVILGERVSAISVLFDQMNTFVQYLMDLLTALIPVMVFLCILKIGLSGQFSLIFRAYKLVPIVLGLCLLFILIYTIYISLRYKVSMVTLFKKAFPVFVLGLTTSASSAALSKNLKVCEESFGIDKKLVSFGVPVGQTLFRPGEAMRYVILGYIMAEMYDVPITISWLIILVFISFLLSVSTPPVAGGSTVCIAIMFRHLGIPDEAIGFAIAINMILGFLLTAVSLYCLQMELIRLGGTLDLLDLKTLRRRDA